MVLKEIIFNSFYFGAVVVLKELIFTVSTVGVVLKGLEVTDFFQQFLLQATVVLFVRPDFEQLIP